MLTNEIIKAWTDTVGERDCGGEIETTCPRCRHHKPRFYIQRDTLAHYCFHCHLGKRGDVWGGDIPNELQGAQANYNVSGPPLTQEYLDKCQAALWNSADGRRIALHYLTQTRGLTTATVRLFGLGFDPDKWAIVIPSFWRSRLVCIKYRTLVEGSQERYHRLRGGDTVLFTQVGLPDSPKRPGAAAFITEGEFDAMTLATVAAAHDVYGFPGKDCKHDDFADEFKDYPHIYIIFDNEPKAQDSAEALARVLGDWRCSAVALPPAYKDVNEWAVAEGGAFQANFQTAVEKAKPFGAPLVLPTTSFIDRAVEHYAGGTSLGVSTGYAALDTITGGLIPGALIGICAPPGVGKTTLALDILCNVALNGHKCLIGSFEMKVAEEMLPKLVSKLVGRNIEMADQRMKPEAYQRILTKIGAEVPITWINRHDRVRIRELYESVRRYYADGYRFLLLDHLQFIMDMAKDGVFEATVKVSRLVKRLTNDFPELCILAIIQQAGYEPSGNSKFKQDTRRPMGGNQIPSDVNQLWWFGEPHTDVGCLTILKARNTTVKKGGSVRINWDRINASYTITEHHRSEG